MFFRRLRCNVPCFAVVALLFVSARAANAADVLAGNQIYSAKCARCHGPHGEGTEHTSGPLAGDLSVAQLGDVIAETMPEDNPGTLSADEASTVAAYIHDAFYSSIARARNEPARISLARLTVRQYRRAVADLINSFRPPEGWGDQRGLRGAYFKSREPNNRNERVADRVDPQVDFDFGTAAPVDRIDEPRRFSIRWTGSVSACETGDYEFIVRTEHAARLWINDQKHSVIDAWVKSGTDTEYKANVFLVAGQAYSLRLDFSKAKLGVDDSDKENKKKPPSPPASIALLWQRPHSVAEPIPTRFLSPDRVPESFVCTVPFPPDDRSYGWERGTAVSAAWDEATTAAAIEAAGYVVDHVDELAGRTKNPANRSKLLLTFCRRFARRAFRRPFDDELRRTYIDRQFDETDHPEDAVRRVVLLVLKSPRFLFRELGGNDDAYNTAARLSFGLWDSVPDPRLLAAARDGELETEDQIRRQAERMLTDLRARAKLQRFLLTWLNVDGEVNLTKDNEKFPDFDDAAIADLRASLELFLDDVLWSESSDYRNLFLSRDIYVNRRLAKLYHNRPVTSAGSPESKRGQGVDEPASNSVFTKTSLDDHRAGILTHPYIMARFSHRDETSPILRGVFLVRGILGQSLRPPPQAVTPIPPELHPDLTTRERVTLQTRDASCMTCHIIINPLGFALERFDAIGSLRDLDNGKPIDATGEYRSVGGTTAKIEGARELAEYLAASDECHAAFAELLFHHLVQQPVQAYGATALDDLRRKFAEHNFNIRQLAIEIMVATARQGRETDHANTAQN